ncbi:hypothetical protein BD779DRAFT_896927 [Infundibulicybe gibba]|nr:hypothetical protein BD779DRAFT_896927 [Infundibulicybe gibba]
MVDSAIMIQTHLTDAGHNALHEIDCGWCIHRPRISRLTLKSRVVRLVREDAPNYYTPNYYSAPFTLQLKVVFSLNVDHQEHYIESSLVHSKCDVIKNLDGCDPEANDAGIFPDLPTTLRTKKLFEAPALCQCSSTNQESKSGKLCIASSTSIP